MGLLNRITTLREIIMISPEIPVRIDLRASCTMEEAVAKMIGWMHGCIRRNDLDGIEHDKTEDQLQHLHSLYVPLEKHLDTMREEARQQLVNAVEENDDFYDKYDALERCDELINLVFLYLVEFTDEVAKGKDSSLRIDQQATETSGIPHFTLKSIDNWSRNNFDIAILSGRFYPPVTLDQLVETGQQSEIENESSTSVAQSELLLDAESAISKSSVAEAQPSDVVCETSNSSAPIVRNSDSVAEICKTSELSDNPTLPEPLHDEMPDKKGGFSRALAEYWQTSFALVVEAYATTLEAINQLDAGDPIVFSIKKKFFKDDGTPIIISSDIEKLGGKGKYKFIKNDGKPNNSAIAKHIEEIAKLAIKNPYLPDSRQKTITGQESNRIRTRIAEALIIKQKKIKHSLQ